MAQASSAAREPSMEEILASIRRIIEDSDVTRQVSSGVAQMSSDASSTEKPTMRGEVAPFRRPDADLNTDQNVKIAEPVATAATRNFERPLLQEKGISTPVNLSEPVRNSVISAVSAAIEAPEAVVLDTNISLRGSLVSEKLNEGEDTEYVTSQPVPANDAPVASSVTDQQDNKVEESVESDVQKIISEMAEKQSELDNVEEKSAVALTSDATKQQVSASFAKLSEAVRQERIRSLEEQAEALLRPMLQNWLDENLPSMVERLVREEIERMVHGNQD